MSSHEFLASDLKRIKSLYSKGISELPEGTPLGTDNYVSYFAELLETKDKPFNPAAQTFLSDPLLAIPVPDNIDEVMEPLRQACSALKAEAARIASAGGFSPADPYNEYAEGTLLKCTTDLDALQRAFNNEAASARATHAAQTAQFTGYMKEHDANGDGVIQSDEAKRIVSNMGTSADDAQKWIEKLDGMSLEKAAELLANAHAQPTLVSLTESRKVIEMRLEERNARLTHHGTLAEKSELLGLVETALEYISSGKMAALITEGAERVEQGLGALANVAELDFTSEQFSLGEFDPSLEFNPSSSTVVVETVFTPEDPTGVHVMSESSTTTEAM